MPKYKPRLKVEKKQEPIEETEPEEEPEIQPEPEKEKKAPKKKKKKLYEKIDEIVENHQDLFHLCQNLTKEPMAFMLLKEVARQAFKRKPSKFFIDLQITPVSKKDGVFEPLKDFLNAKSIVQVSHALLSEANDPDYTEEGGLFDAVKYTVKNAVKSLDIKSTYLKTYGKPIVDGLKNVASLKGIRI
tara:strand:- start:2477 stop:3037 length:561 start_codon:yes stop_codon:yes gene_type:complete